MFSRFVKIIFWKIFNWISIFFSHFKTFTLLKEGIQFVCQFSKNILLHFLNYSTLLWPIFTKYWWNEIFWKNFCDLKCSLSISQAFLMILNLKRFCIGTNIRLMSNVVILRVAYFMISYRRFWASKTTNFRYFWRGVR